VVTVKLRGPDELDTATFCAGGAALPCTCVKESVVGDGEMVPVVTVKVTGMTAGLPAANSLNTTTLPVYVPVLSLEPSTETLNEPLVVLVEEDTESQPNPWS
jgi:hypothetical protein